jgi:hypothetical protein
LKFHIFGSFNLKYECRRSVFSFKHLPSFWLCCLGHLHYSPPPLQSTPLYVWADNHICKLCLSYNNYMII